MKKNLLGTLSLHPFLFAAAPVFYLLGENIVEITFAQSLRSLGWSLLGAAALMLLWLALTRSPARAGLAASYNVILFFTFGDAYVRLRDALPEGSPLAQANVLAALWAVLLILGTWAILRLLRVVDAPTVFLNVAALVFLIGAIYPVAAYSALAVAKGPTVMLHPASLTPAADPAAHKPDIYYIILDGYGRSDSLSEIHNVDNSEFLRFLERRGFTIASGSTTNYARTMHSLSSSLNFHYLDELIVSRPESNDYDAFRALIKDNAAQQFLKQQGYQTVALATGFEITEVSGADVFLSGGRTLSYFEETLLSRTLAVFYVDQVIGDVRREEIHRAFADLESTIQMPGPKFVFAHLVVPHPPFVFDEDGGPVAPRGYGDGTSYAGGRQQYLEAYRRQLLYINTRIEQLVTRIQEQSGTPPVLIIQGDHGPGALVDWIDWQNTCFRERMPILNAYALPGLPADAIPQDITPVNTFRLVFNHYFGADLPMQPNKNYMVTLPRPYEFIDVTDQLDSCPK